MKVLTCQQMRELEERAVRSGCRYSDLMETAGAAVAGYIREHYEIEDKKIVVLCGKGNNGGDGFVVAKRLCDLCAFMTILLVDGLPQTSLAKEKLAEIRETSVRVYGMTDDGDEILPEILSADILVDAVYGIGFHGEVRESMRPIFDGVNQSGATVISVDIPSGLNGDSGTIPGSHIRADATVTFTTLKPVHLFRPAKDECGTVKVSQVGIGKNCVNEQAYDIFVPEDGDIRAVLKPRNPESHKGTYGRLLAVCGSEGMAGAAILSASSAVRSGAGIVDVALPKTIYPIVAANVIEPVYTLLDAQEANQSVALVLEKLKKATACLIGCGLGESPWTDQLVYELMQKAKVPLILDADGINAIARNIDILKTVTVPVILTPHPGEMARLMKSDTASIEANRVDAARTFAQKYDVTVVLKGHNTLIVHPTQKWNHENQSVFSNKTAYNQTGNAGMAKGGSGDVLAGMIASFCAQGISPFAAAYCGVYLHGLAGDRCAKRYSQRGMLPSQMIEELSELFSDYE